MSTSEQVEDRDSGFSLIEIVVAMGLLGVVLVASLPMFLSMVRSTGVTKQQTQAKNLSQERLEQVRDLRFHVANQNGPYLDLLDVYYTDARTGYARPAVTVGSDTLTGQYVSTGGGTNGEPAAPYYRVAIGALAGAPGFSQVVTAQFLGPDGLTPVPRTRFENAYNSQLPGVDSPPTLTLGLTVITTWDQAGQTKRFRTYTQVTETRPDRPVIQSQARAVAVELSSTAADGSGLVLQGGVASLDGSQSSGSAVSGYTTGALARRSGTSVVEGRKATFQLPTNPVVLSDAGSGAAQTSGGACTWFGFGRTSVDNVTGDVAGGLPKAPADVDAPVTPRNAITGRLDDDPSNGCGLLSFTNTVSGGVARTDAVGVQMGAAPFARLASAGTATGAVTGSAYVTATSLLTTPQATRSGGRAGMVRPVVLFPGSPLSGSQGLVSARLTTAAVDCVSGAPGTVAATYSLTVGWYGAPTSAGPFGPRSRTWVYDGTTLTATGDTWDPASTWVDPTTTLDAFVTGGAPVLPTTGANSGQRGFPSGIMTLTTAPTLQGATAGTSAVRVRLGQLTCVADDER